MGKSGERREKAGKSGKLRNGVSELWSDGVLPPSQGRKIAPKRSSSMFMGVSCISKRSRSVAGRQGATLGKAGLMAEGRSDGKLLVRAGSIERAAGTESLEAGLTDHGSRMAGEKKFGFPSPTNIVAQPFMFAHANCGLRFSEMHRGQAFHWRAG